jgi:hypothetical protein
MEFRCGRYATRFHRPSKFHRTQGYATVFAKNGLTVSPLMDFSVLGFTGPGPTRFVG